MLKKILKVTAFIVVALLTLIALFCVEENIRGPAAWNRHLRELAAKGDTLDILKVAPPAIPDAQNLAAAPLFAELMTATNQDQTRLSRTLKNLFPQGAATGDWRLGQRADMAKLRAACSNDNLLAALAPGAEILKEIAAVAAARPQCRFPIQYQKGFACLLPHLGSLRQAARVLQVRALAELNAGQTAAAFNDIRLILRLGNSFETEPMLISLLVRISFNHLAFQPVWEGLADHRWNDAQLQQLQRDFTAINLLNHLDTAFHGERCMAKCCLNELLNNPREIITLSDGGGGNNHDTAVLLTRLIPSGWLYFNCLNVDLCYQQRILPCLDSHASRVFPDRATAVETALNHRDQRAIPYHVLEYLLVPAVSSVVVKSGVAQTAVQNAALACALERYCLTNGKLPGKLEALVPQFIAQLPHDVIDGQPLRYRFDGTNGFVLYSIGWNQKDDGGVVAMTKPASPGGKPRLDDKQGDWVWRSKPAP
jgi:hypothetical protein